MGSVHSLLFQLHDSLNFVCNRLDTVVVIIEGLGKLELISFVYVLHYRNRFAFLYEGVFPLDGLVDQLSCAAVSLLGCPDDSVQALRRDGLVVADGISDVSVHEWGGC